MIRIAARALAAAGALALLTACSTTEAEPDRPTDPPAASASQGGPASNAASVAFPNCEQVATVLAGRLDGYALQQDEAQTDDDITACSWNHTAELIDGIRASFKRQPDDPGLFTAARETAAQMHGENFVDDPLLDGRDAYMFKLDGGAAYTMSYVSAFYQVDLVLVGSAVEDPPTPAEVIGLVDLVEG